MKLCTVGGLVASRAGSRCTDHARQSNRSRHNALYSTRAWQRLSARVLRAWRGEREAGHLSSSHVVDYLRSLPSLWADAGPDGRQALATAISARTEVMGFERLEYELTPDAIELGLDTALPAMFELTGTIGEFGRGERARSVLPRGW